MRRLFTSCGNTSWGEIVSNSAMTQEKSQKVLRLKLMYCYSCGLWRLKRGEVIYIGGSHMKESKAC